MMSGFPIVGREIRRQLRSGLFWAALLGLPAWVHFTGAQGTDSVLLLVAMAGMIVFYGSWRTMTAEREMDTVWMLAATTISPMAVVLQVAAANFLIWGIPVVAGTFAVAGRPLPTLLGPLAKGLPIIALAAAHGALLALWLAPQPARIATVVAVGLPGLAALFFGMQYEQITLVEGLIIGTLLWLGGYLAWRGTGAEWPSLHLAGGSRSSRSCGDRWSVPHLITGWWSSVPDAISPLLWKELMRDKALALGFIAMGVLALMFDHRVSAHAGHYLRAILFGALYLGTLMLLVSSAGSVMRDRREGVWEELRVTGISPASIVRAKVMAPMMLWLSALVVLIGTEVALLSFGAHVMWGDLPYRNRLEMLHYWWMYWGEIVLAALVLIASWWQAILTGLVGGLLASGWKGFVTTVAVTVAYLMALWWSTGELYWFLSFKACDENDTTWILGIYLLLVSVLYIAAMTRFARHRVQLSA